MSCTADLMAHNCGRENNITKDCIEVRRGGGRKKKTTIVVCPVIIQPGSWLPTWLPPALANLWNLTSQIGAQAYLPVGCVGPQCLWFNTSASHVKADLFLVQQMPGTWDLHCNYEGVGVGIGQLPDLIACSQHGNYFDGQYWCAQYPNNCSDVIVRTYEVPLQHQYLAELTGSGHGGFMHSCFLGAYWNSGKFNNTVLKKDTMWWHQIAIDNTTMHDAVAAWWNSSSSSSSSSSDTSVVESEDDSVHVVAMSSPKLYLDCVWQTAPCAAGMLPGQCATEPVWPGPGMAPPGFSPDLPWYTSKYMCNPT